MVVKECLFPETSFNMKVIDWAQYATFQSETHHEHTFLECIQDNFLFQHISEVTRVRVNQTSHIIVLTNDENDIEEITILLFLGVSDHVTILFKSFKEYHTGISKLRYEKCDFKGFSNEWIGVDWHEEFGERDINMWYIFARRSEYSVAKHIPKVIPSRERL